MVEKFLSQLNACHHFIFSWCWRHKVKKIKTLDIPWIKKVFFLTFFPKHLIYTLILLLLTKLYSASSFFHQHHFISNFRFIFTFSFVEFLILTRDFNFFIHNISKIIFGLKHQTLWCWQPSGEMKLMEASCSE